MSFKKIVDTSFNPFVDIALPFSNRVLSSFSTSTCFVLFEVTFLSGFNGSRTHNHLVCKRTLNHLGNLFKFI